MRAIAAVTWIALAALTLPFALQAQTQQTVSGRRINVVGTVESVRVSSGGQVRFYLLWNHEISSRPIGHAYQSCLRSANGGYICNSVYAFPYGKLASTGEARSFARFSAVVTGGTQSRRARRVGHPGYVGAEGTLVTRRVGPGTFTLTFILT